MFLSKFFASDHEIENYLMTAQSWVTWVIVLPIIVILLCIFAKWLWEKRANASGSGTPMFEGRKRTVVVGLSGIGIVLVILFVLWVTDADYRKVMGLSGLGKGIVWTLLEFILIYLIAISILWRYHMPLRRGR